MTSAELVGCIDFRYIEDALSPEEAREILERSRAGRGEREARVRREGFPAYTTSAGWLGYGDDQIADLARAGVEAGFSDFKLKVGADPQRDLQRALLVRKAIGPDRHLMLDANQVWGVDEA